VIWDEPPDADAWDAPPPAAAESSGGGMTVTITRRWTMRRRITTRRAGGAEAVPAPRAGSCPSRSRIDSTISSARNVAVASHMTVAPVAGRRADLGLGLSLIAALRADSGTDARHDRQRPRAGGAGAASRGGVGQSSSPPWLSCSCESSPWPPPPLVCVITGWELVPVWCDADGALPLEPLVRVVTGWDPEAVCCGAEWTALPPPLERVVTGLPDDDDPSGAAEATVAGPGAADAERCRVAAPLAPPPGPPRWRWRGFARLTTCVVRVITSVRTSATGAAARDCAAGVWSPPCMT
jgi:hypothetical protein